MAIIVIGLEYAARADLDEHNNFKHNFLHNSLDIMFRGVIIQVYSNQSRQRVSFCDP